ncbi:MAG: hypothetical protein HQK84_04445, partial [Nitrospinae bacterium]|nr:hypothetical protein [Nitrospinota bacterium]
MAFEQRLSQSLKLSQKLVMTPQLQLAIKLLPMNLMQIKEAINNELAENPMLEEVDEAADTEKSLQNVTMEEDFTPNNKNDGDIELEDFIQSKLDDGDHLDGNDSFNELSDFPQADNIKGKKEEEIQDFPQISNDYKIDNRAAPMEDEFERPIAYMETLQDHLLEQLTMMSKDEITKDIGTEIIGEINDEGYLETPLEEITERINQPPGKVLNVLKLIQTFDPSGIGARNLQECFLLQLEPYHDMAELASVLISNYLEELSPKNLKKLASTLECDMDEIVEAFNLIKSLDPKPGLSYSAENIDYITPEVTVVRNQDDFVVYLNNDDLPFLGVSDNYNGVLESKSATKLEKEFLQEKRKEASWFIKCIEQRKNTVLMVAQSIVDYQ